ncbi:MAG: complex I NDUFA9 subunit family protein [Nitrospinota bacterium]|nr:complex I NDUFA9 subunit family protein [Nitrospinota bacterium]
MKVFVTGSTGFVGRYVVAELKARGHTPVLLVRPGSEAKLPNLEGVKLVPGDVNQPDQYIRALSEVDAVIHLVGIIREFASRGITFDIMHYQATRNITRAAIDSGVRRFIHMSANGAGPQGVSDYQITKWRAEELVMNSRLKWTVFRPSMIFGDSHGLPEFTSQLADVIRHAPWLPIFGGGKYRMDPIAVEDVARCFVAALENQRTVGRAYCLGGGNPTRFSEIAQTIGKAMGKPRTRTISVPFWLVLPVARAMEGFPFFPITSDQLLMLRQGNICARLDYMDVFDITPIPFTYRTMGYLKT